VFEAVVSPSPASRATQRERGVRRPGRRGRATGTAHHQLHNIRPQGPHQVRNLDIEKRKRKKLGNIKDFNKFELVRADAQKKKKKQ